jgi:hypothetical protein
VAVNAAVIGVLGGYGTDATDWPSGVPHPFEDVKVTIEEMAILFGQGPFSFGALLTQLQARNPELALGNSLSNSGKPNPLAPAGSEGVTWFATSAFDALAPEVWKTPSLAISGNPPDVPRGVHDSLALADPPFVAALFELYSAQALLKKLVAENTFKPFNYGPIWVLTDLATAELLDIPTVAIENSRGEFVQPTPESLHAAVTTMVQQPDGTFLPEIDGSGDGLASREDAAGAYPLTFVEHAVVPAEPLVDVDCNPRTASQAVLADWLTFITGPGQASLAPGLVALTPELATAATESIALVGDSTLSGACAPDPPDPPGEPPLPPGAPPGAPPGLPGGNLGGVPPGGLGGDPSDPTSPGGYAGGGTPTDESSDESDDPAGADLDGDGDVDEADLPGLDDSKGSGALAGSAALLGLAALGAAGGTLSGGRRGLP